MWIFCISPNKINTKQTASLDLICNCTYGIPTRICHVMAALCQFKRLRPWNPPSARNAMEVRVNIFKLPLQQLNHFVVWYLTESKQAKKLQAKMKIKCKNPARYTIAINRPTIHHKSEPSSNNNCVKGFAFRKTVWKPKTQEHKKRVPLPPRTGLCCSLASIALHVENHRRIIKSRQGAIAFWKSSSCRILSGCMFVFSWQQKWDTAQVECSTPHLSCLQLCHCFFQLLKCSKALANCVSTLLPPNHLRRQANNTFIQFQIRANIYNSQSEENISQMLDWTKSPDAIVDPHRTCPTPKCHVCIWSGGQSVGPKPGTTWRFAGDPGEQGQDPGRQVRQIDVREVHHQSWISTWAGWHLAQGCRHKVPKNLR